MAVFSGGKSERDDTQIAALSNPPGWPGALLSEGTGGDLGDIVQRPPPHQSIMILQQEGDVLQDVTAKP